MHTKLEMVNSTGHIIFTAQNKDLELNQFYLFKGTIF